MIILPSLVTAKYCGEMGASATKGMPRRRRELKSESTSNVNGVFGVAVVGSHRCAAHTRPASTVTIRSVMPTNRCGGRIVGGMPIYEQRQDR
jgi:hypothetical protein